MPIAMESGRGHGGGGGDLFGLGGALRPAAASAAASSAGWGSDSRVGMLHCEDAAAAGEEEESDGEVESSYRGPLDTMDALQQALPRSRRRGTKFDNSKSSFLVSAKDDVLSSQHTKPEVPSPKKRKGLLPSSVDKNKSQSKELSPVDDATSSPTNSTSSPTNCRKALYPAVVDSSPGKNRGYDERECCKNRPCHCLQTKSINVMDAFASPTIALLPELTSVQTKLVAISLNEVAELTDVISPSEKRRKN
ncbi:uncharacterized protein LOC127775838 isoform X2 [Oryza glaberrima]|uniref:uncharacterized protein LOC127775838 isoform X2 n=1 Tax=Oryza glaberrima TaxID=4538 RepID=UPI00224BF0A7|nr:uncharacterized protein LOC127775838 isoform X2 [Oryza glaberrima]